MTNDRPNIVLAALVGIGAEGKNAGHPIYKGVARFVLVPDEGAQEAVLQAVEEAHSGSFSAQEEAGRWAVTLIEAGISSNGNFWPASVLREHAARVWEDAALEAIGVGKTQYKHPPTQLQHAIPGGLVMNAVGQVLDVSWSDSATEGQGVETAKGGRKPTQEEAEAIAAEKGWTVDRVFEECVGSAVAVASLDDDADWLDKKLASAEDRGKARDYIGLSVDVQEAAFTPVKVPGRRTPIRVRDEINPNGGYAFVDFVARPSAGGAINGRAA